MKIAACFLALATCIVALPASFDTPDELDLSKLTPQNIYLEPVSKSNALPGDRIIGGQEVSPNSVPYQVAVIINNSGLCGGSLISSNRVLTAAHCTESAAFVQVRLGAHAFNTNETTQVRVTSTSIINHENYNQGGFAANDVAIILLPSTVTLTNSIRTINLAPSDAGTFAGSTAFLSGWGMTSDAANGISPVLRGINLNIISNTVCMLSFGTNVLTSTLCTSGAGTVGACSSDSGGPLVVDGVQVGVVSFGASGCEAEYPTAFARISSFRTWISQAAGV